MFRKLWESYQASGVKLDRWMRQQAKPVRTSVTFTTYEEDKAAQLQARRDSYAKYKKEGKFQWVW